MPDDFKIIDEPTKTVVPTTTTTTPVVLPNTTPVIEHRGEPPVLVEPRSPTTPPTTPPGPPVRPTTTALATGTSVKYRVLVSVVLGRYTGEVLLSQEIGDSQKIEDMLAMGAIEKVL